MQKFNREIWVKKITAIVLCFAILASFAACVANKPVVNDDIETAAPTATAGTSAFETAAATTAASQETEHETNVSIETAVSETTIHEHNYTSEKVEPTCTENGYTQYTCECGDSYRDDEVKAKGHNYKNTVVEPTETKKGYTKHKCRNCGHSYKDNYTEPVPKETKPAETTPPTTETPPATESVPTETTQTVITPTETAPSETQPSTTAPVPETSAPPATEGMDVAAGINFTDVNETVYANKEVNIRTGPSTDYEKIGQLKWGESITRIGIGDNGWSKVLYNGETAYMYSGYLQTDKPVATVTSGSYPMTYSDGSCTITIYKEWYENAYVYAAHLQFSDYTRFGVACAKGKYNSGKEKTSSAAARLGAIFCVNGDYAVPGNGAGGYAIARGGVVCNDQKFYAEGFYNNHSGILAYRTHNGCEGKQLSSLVAEGKVTDTFQFGPAFLLNGAVLGDPKSNSRAQRTFIGTNGSAGDIWVCVSDGRYNDGKSAGLNGYQCAAYLASKGCTFGIPLDGGGSSTMYFNGKVLNAASGGQRSIADFVYLK